MSANRVFFSRIQNELNSRPVERGLLSIVRGFLTDIRACAKVVREVYHKPRIPPHWTLGEVLCVQEYDVVLGPQLAQSPSGGKPGKAGADDEPISGINGFDGWILRATR